MTTWDKSSSTYREIGFNASNSRQSIIQSIFEQNNIEYISTSQVNDVSIESTLLHNNPIYYISSEKSTNYGLILPESVEYENYLITLINSSESNKINIKVPIQKNITSKIYSKSYPLSNDYVILPEKCSISLRRIKPENDITIVEYYEV